MKKINLLLSILTITFLSACDSGTTSTAAPNTAAPSTATPSTAAPSTTTPSTGSSNLKENIINTSDLSAPEGFDFTSERIVDITLSVASSQNERGFMSIYTESKEGKVDSKTQIVLTPMNDKTEFRSSVMLPNHVNKIWVEVWYPDALGTEIKASVDIVDDTASAIL
jgi:hypothetical protein